jgi:membrane associated rhomboid family serine protease
MRLRVDPVTDLRANAAPSEPAIPPRPYSFAEDIRKTLRVPPPATLALFLITVGAFIGQVLGGSSDWQRAVGIIPTNVADASSLVRVGDTQLLPAWLTLFSYMFLHSGLFHLLTNAACLWLFGVLAEPVMGTKRFALTYLAFGTITGMTIVALVPHWSRPMVGASGSISGILGAFLAIQFSESIRQWRQTFVVILLEATPALAVTGWLVARSMPSAPDRASAAAWHLIPFLLGWYSARAWGLRSPWGTKRCN